MFNISKSHIFEGYWAFSLNQSYWFSGVLKFFPEKEKIELRMWGAVERCELDFYSDTILGKTVDNKKITLINCIIRKSSSQLSLKPRQGKTYHYVIQASEILIGEHYNKIEDIKFSYLQLQFNNQIEFIQKNGFQYEYTSNALSITYQNVEDFKLLQDDKRKILIQFSGYPESKSYPPNYSSIAQHEYFVITYPVKQQFVKMREEINFLKHFLSFSTNRTSNLVTCYFNESDSIDLQAGVFILNNSCGKRERKHHDYGRHQSIILLDNLNQYPDLYKNWRGICEIKESAIYKFFTTIHNDNNFLDERFHKLILAFEDYHRHSLDFPQKVKFTKKKTGKEEERNVNLRERIEGVFHRFSKPISYLFDKYPNEKERIIKLIKNTRDYLTHGGDVNKEKAVKDQNSYFDLADLLIILISLMILKDLGLSDSDIKKRIWNLPEYKYLVSNDWSIVL